MYNTTGDIYGKMNCNGSYFKPIIKSRNEKENCWSNLRNGKISNKIITLINITNSAFTVHLKYQY